MTEPSERSQAQKELCRAVHEAIGEASMCWTPLVPSGVFDSDRAAGIGLRLCSLLDAVVHEARQEALREVLAEVNTYKCLIHNSLLRDWLESKLDPEEA